MATSVFAGCGASVVARRLPRSLQHPGIGLLVLLCVAERLWASPGLAPIGTASLPLPGSLEGLELPAERPALLHLPLPTDPFDGEIEGARYHMFAQLREHHRPLVFRGARAWTSAAVPPEEMACHLERLSSLGVGAIAVSENLDEVAPLFTRRHPDWLTSKYAREIPIIRRNLRQIIAPDSPSGTTEIYYLPDPGDLLADPDVSCESVDSSGSAKPAAGLQSRTPPSAVQSIGPAEETGSPRLPAEFQQHGMGPNSPYPLSFPKMFAAIVYFEESVPELRVTQAQAQDLLLPVSSLADAWEQVRAPQGRLNQFLSCEQIAFIVARKGECRTSYEPQARASSPNISWEIVEAVELLRARKDPHSNAAFVPCPQDRLHVVKYGETPLIGASLFDTACGVLEMESDGDLRVRPEQAVGLFELLDSVVNPLVMVNASESLLRDRLTDAQVERLVQDFDRIAELKRARGGEARLGDDEHTSDLLSVRVMQILQARAEGRPVPPDELPRSIPGTYVEPGVQPPLVMP